ncbi:LysM peptidoglycan-binding domain-containing protein [Paenibacillus mucilaginosus]|uniref:LysM peptidoglycan-binding domain-containing protein n=1 Tax=Paenibacillus mucilaginosus TaxID=61624 RepID=UPI001EF0EC40|nr:LysM peptidoglycan-binding domain-containing protein [Paenibacillus mucilaginosus]MCG7213145.1 LysM peptidoglycan-binding domain-containing protein [Paenibacillus mucilaginosus]WDM26455.1 LysM peptidoglycan-binding domain-containing protein [Paenibacillus mucilaginosus]
MKIHIVKNGDSLYALSQKYNVELEKLIAANPQIADPNELTVGAKVKIPLSPKPAEPPSDYLYKHVVSQGDTLWKLGKAWGIPLSDMVAANPHLKNPNVLMTGDVVYIPKLKPEGAADQADAAGNPPKKDTSVISPEEPLPVEAAPISDLPLAPNVDLPELPAVPAPPVEAAPAVEAPAPIPNMGALPVQELPQMGDLSQPNAGVLPANENLPQPNAGVLPAYDMPQPNAGMLPAFDMPQPNVGALPAYDMPQPNAGVLPAYDMPQPNAGMLPAYDMPQPNVGALPAYDMPQPNAGMLPAYDMPQPNVGALPAYDMPQPNMGILPSYDNMPQPNMGALPAYDMPQPNAGVLPSFDNMPEPNWGAIDFGLPQAVHPFDQFNLPAAEAMAVPEYPGKGKENAWHEPELPNAPFPYGQEPAAEHPFYMAPGGYPGYPQAAEPWAVPAGDCGCGGGLNLPYALPSEGFPPLPPVPDAPYGQPVWAAGLPAAGPYDAFGPFGYGAAPYPGFPLPHAHPYGCLPGYPGVSPYPQWAGPAAEAPFGFEAPFPPQEELPFLEEKGKGKKGKGGAELPAKSKKREERAVIAQSAGTAAVREEEQDAVREPEPRAKTAVKAAAAPKRRSRQSEARAALAALIERSHRRASRGEPARRARPWLND